MGGKGEILRLPDEGERERNGLVSHAGIQMLQKTKSMNVRLPIRSVLLLSLVLSVVGMGGCSGPIERKWSEEVALDDGSVIVVDRRVESLESNSLAGDAFSSTITKSTLEFRDALSSLPTWDFPLRPLVLYRDENVNEWVIVGTNYTCEFWYAHGMPKPPYWEFRLRNGSWEKVPLSALSLQRRTNLFILYERGIPSKMIKHSTKDELMRNELVGAGSRSISPDEKANCESLSR